MVIFHSYVSLPEGSKWPGTEDGMFWSPNDDVYEHGSMRMIHVIYWE